MHLGLWTNLVRRDNLLQFFRDYFASGAEYVGYDDGYRRRAYSYRQVNQSARIFANRLREAGIGKGDRILLWAESRPEWLFAFWGSLLVGAVVVPIGSELSFDFVRKVQAVAEPKVIALGDDVSWNCDFPGVPVWRLSAANWTLPPSEVTSPEIRSNDLAEIVFTSGSTGEPKGVALTHGNLLSQVESVEPSLRVYRRLFAPLVSAKLLLLLPLSHMFGQVAMLGLTPLISGAVVITRRQSPAGLLHMIRERHISAVVCVPRFLDALRGHVIRLAPETNEATSDRRSIFRRLWHYRRLHRMFGWRFLGFLPGGAALEPDLECFWAGLGFLVVQGYGLTETSPVVTMNQPLWPRRGSVGKALPGVEVGIAGDGEILVRGPNVTAGYFRQPGKTVEVLRNGGWFHTGDLGYLDPRGHLYIRGRKDEVIVTSEGFNVFPEDVENVLDKLPGVRESAVIGRSALGGGEQAHAVVVLEPGADSATIMANANRQLEAHQRIQDISVWPDGPLPRTPQTAKLRHGEIRDRIAGLRPSLERPAVSARECTPEVVREEIERRTGRRAGPEKRLDELGLTSIDRVELLLEFERLCQREIDETEFAACQTVGEWKEIIERVLIEQGEGGPLYEPDRSEFPVWNRTWFARLIRNAHLATWILPLTRFLAKPIVSGVEKLDRLDEPVIFASNHQSHLDTPLILAALPERWRYRVAVAMFKEYFAAHFHPKQYSLGESAASSFQYYLAALLVNAFPIPQQEPGVRRVLQYAGDLVSDGWSLLIYPEGERRSSNQMGEFQPGVGLLATRLKMPVVPVHLEGVDRVLPRGTIIPRLGQTHVTFGEPVHLRGEDPRLLAHELEETIQTL